MEMTSAQLEVGIPKTMLKANGPEGRLDSDVARMSGGNASGHNQCISVSRWPPANPAIDKPVCVCVWKWRSAGDVLSFSLSHTWQTQMLFGLCFDKVLSDGHCLVWLPRVVGGLHAGCHREAGGNSSNDERPVALGGAPRESGPGSSIALRPHGVLKGAVEGGVVEAGGGP